MEEEMNNARVTSTWRVFQVANIIIARVQETSELELRI